MLVDSLRAGTMTVRDGLPSGLRLYLGSVRSGTRRRLKAAVIAFQSQRSAMNQANAVRAGWRVRGKLTCDDAML